MNRFVKFGPSEHRPDDEFALVAVAEDVAIDRGRMVAETLFHIAAIRSLPNAPVNATVHCDAAELQDTTAQDGQQAAHLLPGRITVNKRPIWEWADPNAAGIPAAIAHDVLVLEQQTMWCFAKTTVLPAIFNRADSQAEGRTTTNDTLKPLFGQTVQQLWSSARVTGGPLAVDRAAVLAALTTWFARVNVVYQLAADKKMRAARQAVGTANERFSEALVLRTYANSFAVANAGRFVDSHARTISQRYRWV